MQRLDEMLTPPEVGKRYIVPGISYRFCEIDGWFPVIGTRHEDAEHINFPYQHYHPDFRFLNARAYRAAIKRAGRYGERAIYGIPLMNHDRPDHGPVTYRARKCLRVPPINTIFTEMENGRALHNAWAGRDARRGPHGLICPHRGTPLGSVAENPDGTIICPLHGLKFCARTGKSIPTSA